MGELTGVGIKMTVGREVAQRVYAAIDDAGQRGIVEFLGCTFAITGCDFHTAFGDSYQIELQMIEAGSQPLQDTTTKSPEKLIKHKASQDNDDQDNDIEEALTAMRLSLRGA